MHIKPDLPCENQNIVSKQTTTSHKSHQGVYRLTRACRSRWKKHRTKYAYDAGNQLLSAVLNSTGTGATALKQYAYGYDLAGNRTGEQIGTGTNGPVAVSQSGYNIVNQLTNRATGSGPMLFAGSLNEQAIVTVGGNSATVNHTTTNFMAYVNVTNGTSTNTIIATDYSNNSRTNKYQLVVTNNGVAQTISYDLNGNETSVVTATSTNNYQWDALNRLVSITSPTNQSLFAYDGLGRRVQIVELTNGVAYITNKFLWDGNAMAEQRDLTGGTVVKRFFGQGEQISGVNYFFTRDHLGSVREMTDSAGTIHARYDYDPYGRRTKISGDLDADFAFTGFYYHAASGLYLALYRQYSADLGRWLSRDPSGETSGLNLYAYCGNNPINGVDLFGLRNWAQFAEGVGLLIGGAVALGVGIATIEIGVGVVLAPSGAVTLAAGIDNIIGGLSNNQTLAQVESEVPTNAGGLLGFAADGTTGQAIGTVEEDILTFGMDGAEFTFGWDLENGLSTLLDAEFITDDLIDDSNPCP